MKRDMELVRTVLFAVEARPDVGGWFDLAIDGHTADEVSYHVKIMAQGGLLDAHELTTYDGFCWKPDSLTWQGHDFLDAVRSDTIWKKTKSLIAQKGGSVPFEVLQQIVIKMAASMFE